MLSKLLSHGLRLAPSTSLHLPPSPSISLHLPPSPSTSLHLPPSPSTSVTLGVLSKLVAQGLRLKLTERNTFSKDEVLGDRGR